MRPLLIVKAGSTLPDLAARHGDFEDWIAARLDAAPLDVVTVNAEAGTVLPRPDASAGVVVTGSSAMVTERAAWSEAAAAWLAGVAQAGTPILGICYGHQLLAHGLGGRVGPNPRGREIGTVRVGLSAAGDGLLGALPEEITVQVTHRESVLAIPDGAVVLGANRADPYQAIRFAERVWGVQFHPEFDADVMRGYLTARREELIEEGLDASALLGAVADAPHGAQLLAQFGEIVREREGARPS